MTRPTPTSRPVAIVTGASRGIGRATAERFASEGWRVINLARTSAESPGVEDHRVDLADLDALAACFDGLAPALESAPRICLVQNAAVMDTEGLRELDVARFERAMRLNVTAPALLSARALPLMGPGSSILFIGSTLSEKGVPGRLSYVTSKHALVGLMRAMTQDLFGRGVHTACICPGFTETEMLRDVLDRSPEIEAAVLSMVSFGRLIGPAEIADLVWYAAGQPVLNGATIHANLGQRES